MLFFFFSLWSCFLGCLALGLLPSYSPPVRCFSSFLFFLFFLALPDINPPRAPSLILNILVNKKRDEGYDYHEKISVFFIWHAYLSARVKVGVYLKSSAGYMLIFSLFFFGFFLR